MSRNIEDAISALSYSLVQERLDGAIGSIRQINVAARFVVEQQERLPDLFRLPMRVLWWLFLLSAFCQTGKRFCALTLERRLVVVNRWRKIPLKPLREFVRFHQSLAVLKAAECSG